MDIKSQVSEETLFWSQSVKKKKKSRPQTTEALLRACFVQVLSLGKASGREGAGRRLELAIQNSRRNNPGWGVPFKRREWHEQRHGGRNV